MKTAIVTGGGGFIGHHLIRRLRNDGYWVRGVDQKLPVFEESASQEFRLADLRRSEEAHRAFASGDPWDEAYLLAADMGGMGFISKEHVAIMRNNLRINLNCIEECAIRRVGSVFFASSACVYPEHAQLHSEATPLRESDAHPAAPQDAYGWEKLVIERHLADVSAEGLNVRVARFHNIYGPKGAWEGGREKAPAALCRKVAFAKLRGDTSIELWGDGRATRSFCYIDDAVEGVRRLVSCRHNATLNIGSSELVSVDDLAFLVMEIAGVDLGIRHVPGPEGVRGRNSNNELCLTTLNWEPTVSLRMGLEQTYAWVEEQVKKRSYGQR